MSSNQSGEGEIRKSIIEADLVDCMVALPGQLFYSTQIPVCLWFLRRDKRRLPSPSGRGAGGEGCRDRRGEVLFIDARKMGTLVDRVHRELTDDDLAKIANTYHLWRGDPHLASGHPLPKGEGHYRGGFDFSGMVETARELRKKQTSAEAIMWELLRDRRFADLKFRRQHQIGDYVADFYCDENKLVVELDGPVHDDPKQARKDKTRNAYLQSLGLTVIRIRNDELLSHPESALNKIAAYLPSHAGRGAGGEAPGERSYYMDIPGFCRSATLDDIRKHGHVLTPGRYVGAETVEDDGEPFDEKMRRLVVMLNEQLVESEKLDNQIRKNLKELGYGS
jgi:very-short-patch-repair endonuclease